MFNKLRSIIFKLDPELAHNLAIKALKYNYIPNNKIPANSLVETEIFGKKISNPIGLAAGFDKDAEVYNSFYKLGFGHAPVMSGSTRATEGQRRIVSSSSTTFSATLYESLSACSTAINDGITDTLGISSTKETALKAQDGRTNILVESSQALRVQSVQKQLSIHGIRKILGTLNAEADKLESLQVVLGVTTVTEIME